MKEKRFYGWTLVGVFSLVYFLNTSFPMYGAGVINSYMAQSLNMSRSVLGLGVTVFSLTYGLLSPITAFSVNKLGVRLTLSIGATIMSFGALIMSFAVKDATSYIVTYGCVMGFGFGLGAMIPMQSGITLWFRKKKALALSIVLAIAGLGGIVAAPTANKIIQLSNGNWRVAWLFVAVFLFLSAVASMLFVKNKPSDLNQVQDGFISEENQSNGTNKRIEVYQTKADWPVRKAVRTRSLWLLVFASITVQGGYLMCVAHSVINLMDKGIPNDMAAMSLGLITSFSIIGRLGSGYLGDKYEPRWLYSIGLFIFAIGCFSVIYVTNIVGIFIYTFCTGIGIGISFVCSPIIYGNYFGTKTFASLMGTIAPIQSSVGALSPLLAGVLYDAYGSYNVAFIFVSILLAMGSIGLIFATPPRMEEEAE
ncbi:MAG: MFS transporter [Clostridia bacterium]|nr:MFS transporter [Clostridia bacterium]